MYRAVILLALALVPTVAYAKTGGAWFVVSRERREAQRQCTQVEVVQGTMKHCEIICAGGTKWETRRVCAEGEKWGPHPIR